SPLTNRGSASTITLSFPGNRETEYGAQFGGEVRTLPWTQQLSLLDLLHGGLPCPLSEPLSRVVARSRRPRSPPSVSALPTHPWSAFAAPTPRTSPSPGCPTSGTTRP